MAMNKRGSAPIVGNIKTGKLDDKKEEQGITKCAKCGKVFLAARGKCPSCNG